MRIDVDSLYLLENAPILADRNDVFKKIDVKQSPLQSQIAINAGTEYLLS